MPIELLQQGWKKFWSKRENRPYFWNKLTGESLWEFPPLRHVCINTIIINYYFIKKNLYFQYDITSDPLGISNEGDAVANPMLLKKRPAEELVLGPATKKLILT